MIEVPITEAHIQGQKNPGNCTQCAIHDALKERFPERRVIVRLDDIRIGEETFYVSPALYGWQMGNIHSSAAQPFTLHLDLETQYASMDKEAKIEPTVLSEDDLQNADIEDSTSSPAHE